jgi:hypothetical protein
MNRVYAFKLPKYDCSSCNHLWYKPLEQQGEAHAIEMPTTEITPPPTTAEPIEKEQHQRQEPSDTVRRQLFAQIDEETASPQQRIAVTAAEPMATAGPQQPITEIEDEPITQASKKAKYE